MPSASPPPNASHDTSACLALRIHAAHSCRSSSPNRCCRQLASLVLRGPPSMMIIFFIRYSVFYDLRRIQDSVQRKVATSFLHIRCFSFLCQLQSYIKHLKVGAKIEKKHPKYNPKPKVGAKSKHFLQIQQFRHISRVESPLVSVGFISIFCILCLVEVLSLCLDVKELTNGELGLQLVEKGLDG